MRYLIIGGHNNEIFGELVATPLHIHKELNWITKSINWQTFVSFKKHNMETISAFFLNKLNNSFFSYSFFKLSRYVYTHLNFGGILTSVAYFKSTSIVN